MLNNEQVGLRIKIAREEKQLTLQDIADKIGVTKSTIQRYEAGRIENIKLPVISAIANALDVSPSWVIGKTDQKRRNAPSFELSETYIGFAKALQERNISEDDFKKMLSFYEMIKK